MQHCVVIGKKKNQENETAKQKHITVMFCLPDFRSRASNKIFLLNFFGHVPCLLQLLKCKA